MGEYITVWFTLADLAIAPDDVRRVGALALVLGERHGAWRGQRVREVWLPYRLAFRVTGFHRGQVSRIARRLSDMMSQMATAA